MPKKSRRDRQKYLNPDFDKERKRIEKSKIQNLEGFEKVGEKADGVSEGGVYSKNGQLYMLKAMDPYSTASEYIGANIARLYVGDSAPIVDLVRGKDGKLFVASKFIDNFETLKALGEKINLPQECFPYGCVVDTNGTLHPVVPYLQNMVTEHKKMYPEVRDAELINIIADYLQHDDAHDRNVGLRKLSPRIDVMATSLIDFSWSLRGERPGSKITYNSEYSQNYNPQKTVEAIDRVLEVPPKEIEKITVPLFKNLEKFYGQDNLVFIDAVPPSNYPYHIVDLVQKRIQGFLGVDWSSKKTLKEVKNNMISSLEERAGILRQEKQRLEEGVFFSQGASRVPESYYTPISSNVAGRESISLGGSQSLAIGATEPEQRPLGNNMDALDAVVLGAAALGAIKTLRRVFNTGAATEVKAPVKVINKTKER